MKATIKVCSASFSKNTILRHELSALASNYKDIQVIFAPSPVTSEAQVVEFLDDADIAIVGLEPLNKSTLSKLINLKLIAKYGVGLDNIDLEYAKSLKIKIGWQPGLNKRSVAEMTLAFMISLCRNLSYTNRALLNANWVKDGGTQLTGKKVGLIGLGNIGREVAKLLHPFECELYYNDLSEDSDFAFTYKLNYASKEFIFKECELISLHIPLDQSTKHLINIETLGQMKPTAYLINTSRGGLINEGDLKKALNDEIILGAALDVFENEPSPDQELIQHPRVISTPHIGGNSMQAVLAMGRGAISKIKEFLDETD